MEPLISVIVPVYNVEKYVTKCVNSIINQTYKNLEIILIDDGSTDNSGNICNDLQKKDDRIKVIHKKNGGLSDARNCGIDIANGDYIAFVDSDDYIHNRMYEILMHNALDKNADISMCGYMEADDYTLGDATIVDEMEVNNSDIKIYKSREEKLLCIFPSKIRFTVVWNKLYSKQIWEEYRFKTGEVYEDEQIYYKILYNCKKIVTCEDKMYYYVQRENSITGNDITLKIGYKINAYENKFYYFLEKNEKKAVKSALFEWKSLLVDSYCKNEIFKSGEEKKAIKKLLERKKKRFAYERIAKKNYHFLNKGEIQSYIMFLICTDMYIEHFSKKHRNIYCK